MIKLAFFNLFRRKIRTFLAVLGIVIGITALITLTAVIDGIYNEMTSVFGSFQGVMVMQKGVADQPFSRLEESLGQKLTNVQGVRTVVSEIWAAPKSIDNQPLRFTSMSSFVFIYGIDPAQYKKLRGSGWIGELERGEMLGSNDKSYVLLGKNIADDRKKFVGSNIRVNEKQFKVKGILKTESELYGNIIVMDIDVARELAGISKDKVNTFYVELEDPKEDKKVAQLINFLYGSQVEAMATSDFSETVSNMLGNFNIVAFAIAAISAFVAAMGIINTILMSVMERYKEIGTLKASGWTSWSIMKLILLESAFMGLLGGLIGIFIGIAIAHYIDTYFGIPTLVTTNSVVQAALFAFFVGLFAGAYPAYRAAKLDPVEAMRGA
ncbi:MAG: ABC transporter permease [Candidatus Diapherotrites archaeon]|nr:ABC transporter permease [Candidatus Diapherotrites archaeon]